MQGCYCREKKARAFWRAIACIMDIPQKKRQPEMDRHLVASINNKCALVYRVLYFINYQ